MEDRRQHTYIKGKDMDDIKDRLTRIEQQGTDAQVSTRVLENSFDNHSTQNAKDFKHMDDCIHRTEEDSKVRDDSLAKQVERMSDDIQELKQFMYRAGGALLVLVPLVNHIAGKYL
jgi:hypothetical protein